MKICTVATGQGGEWQRRSPEDWTEWAGAGNGGCGAGGRENQHQCYYWAAGPDHFLRKMENTDHDDHHIPTLAVVGHGDDHVQLASAQSLLDAGPSLLDGASASGHSSTIYISPNDN